MNTIGTIEPPEKPKNIPSNSQWISGQGGGVWFSISPTNIAQHFNIKRYTPKGELDCDRIFEIEKNNTNFDIQRTYKFIHISHCSKCRIRQDEVIYIFNYLEQ